MKNAVYISAIIFVIFLSACGDKTTTTTEVNDTTASAAAVTDGSAKSTTSSNTASWANYTINLPEGWRAENKQDNGRELFFLIGPTEMNYNNNINILKDPMKGLNLEDYIKSSLAKMQNMKIQMGPQGNFSADGISGRYLKYLYNAPQRLIAVKSYVFAKNDTAYVVTATTVPELGKKYEPIFDSSVNSLKIN